MAPSFNVISSLVCGDVRIENSGKEIIIGVYVGGMSLVVLPGTATICVWMLGTWDGEGGASIVVRMLDPQKAQVGQASGIARAIFQGRRSSITVRGLTFNVGIPG